VRISTQCRECGFPFRDRITPGRAVECPNCSHRVAVPNATWQGDRVEACALCGCEHLYRQRDFNRGLGCLLVAIGAVLVPWTYGLSLVGLSLVDLWLYRRLRDSVVCYRCDTVYRDATPTARQGEVDLLKHDIVKYGKTWQELPPADDSGDQELDPRPDPAS
jgi:DNA-directed RNA polymerase subunit RPC12/RpoP